MKEKTKPTETEIELIFARDTLDAVLDRLIALAKMYRKDKDVAVNVCGEDIERIIDEAADKK